MKTVTIELSDAQFDCLCKIAALFRSDVATVLRVSGIGFIESFSAEDYVDMWDEMRSSIVDGGEVSDDVTTFLVELGKIRDWEHRYCRPHPNQDEQDAANKRGNLIGYRAEEVPHVS